MILIVLLVILQTVAGEIGSVKNLNEEEEFNHIFRMYENHASIVKIQGHVTNIDSPFQVTLVTIREVKTSLRVINSNKAMSCDIIPKLVTAVTSELVQSVSSLVNMYLSL